MTKQELITRVNEICEPEDRDVLVSFIQEPSEEFFEKCVAWEESWQNPCLAWCLEEVDIYLDVNMYKELVCEVCNSEGLIATLYNRNNIMETIWGYIQDGK